MLNVLIPAAGLGSRFTAAGYTFPKPLISVCGKPMIQHVVENLAFEDARYIFLIQSEHREKYNIDKMLQQLTRDPIVISVNGLTEGAAVTALLAKEFIDNDDELMIANSDQIVDFSLDNFNIMRRYAPADAIIMTFRSTHPKWSFVSLNEDNRVTEVAEKRPISDVATSGIYWYRQGRFFVDAAESMIAKNQRVNNEFYIAPAFNEMIAHPNRKLILPFFVDKMHGLGTPEDLAEYVNKH